MRTEDIKEFYGGTGTVFDRKRSFYDAGGFTGNIRDQERQWLAILGFKDGGLLQGWRELLATSGKTLKDKVRVRKERHA